MQRGEIYLASFPFGDVPGMKLRPVLLLTDPVGPVAKEFYLFMNALDQGVEIVIKSKPRSRR
jgi:hypothetical protein